jgi:hypothetical protein
MDVGLATACQVLQLVQTVERLHVVALRLPQELSHFLIGDAAQRGRPRHH